MLSFLRVSLSLMLLMSLSACSNFRDLNNDLKVIEQDYSRYQIHVELSDMVVVQDQSPLVLVSLSAENTQGIEVYRLLGKAGNVDIRDSSGLVAFFVFQDINHDLTFQINEPFGFSPITKGGGNGVVSVDVNVQSADKQSLAAPDYLLDQNLLSFRDLRGMGINIGTVTSLDDARFSLAQGKKGMWQPLQFMLDGGAGLHQLQPYDAHKTPVLFVHGLSGSPVNFSDMIAALDHTHYQPWVYSYPSGYNVDVTSNGLFYMVNALQRELEFKNLHIVSHSLGGLLSRTYLKRCQRENECAYLSSYTSLSAPWGGSSGAKLGADTAPVVMPVWEDLSPNSELLASLFAEPLPNELPHFLMFSFFNDSRFGSGSSDGVVALSSQLRREAQQQALKLSGYNESHSGILKSKVVMKDWLEFMDAQH